MPQLQLDNMANLLSNAETDETPKICRTCLEKTFEDNEMLGHLEYKMLEILPVHIRKSVSRNPVICSLCSKKLQESFDFKTSCLTNDDYLRTFINKSTNVINLEDMILNRHIYNDSIKTEREKVCRLCLKYYEYDCLVPLNNLEDWLLNDMVDRCLPEVDLTDSLDPLVCNNCIRSLQNQFNFIVQCCDTEEIINNYIFPMEKFAVSTEEVLDLRLVHEYLLNFRSDDIHLPEGLDCVKKKKDNGDNFSSNDMYVSDVAESEYEPDSEIGSEYEAESDDEFVEECGSKFSDVHSKRIVKKTYRGCGFPPSRQRTHVTFQEFACSQCPYKATRKDNFHSHLLIHQNLENANAFKCDLCSFKTKWRSSLFTHKFRHKKPAEITFFKCDNCSYKSKYKKHLRRHMRTHLKGKIYSCGNCTLRTKSRRFIENHLCHKKDFVVETEGEEGRVKVSPETEITEDMAIYTKIIEPLKNSWWYKCNKCSYEAKKTDHIKQHILKHLGRDEVTLQKCRQCSFKSKYKASMRLHMKKHKK